MNTNKKLFGGSNFAGENDKKNSYTDNREKYNIFCSIYQVDL